MNIDRIFDEVENKSPWLDTKFARYIPLSAKLKGKFGELYTEEYIRSNYDFLIFRAENNGHDRIIKNVKTEIKFSLETCVADRKNPGLMKLQGSHTFNHIALEKDWERIIFTAILYKKINSPIMRWFSKSEIKKYIRENIFSHQQGGKSSDNDDYMSNNKFTKILETEGHLMNEW